MLETIPITIDRYGIHKTFIVMKLQDSFAIEEYNCHMSRSDYMKTVETAIKNKNVIYIYIEKDPIHCERLWNREPKNVISSVDPFHFFLMDEMENDFKNCSIDINKIAFYECCINYIKEHKNIPTLKDFIADSGREISIYVKNGQWTLEVRGLLYPTDTYKIYIQGVKNPVVEYDKDSVINHIRKWIRENEIEFSLEENMKKESDPLYIYKKTKPILRLLKYFIGYDLDKDKEEEEFFTKRQLAHLNKIINECCKRVAELKTGGLDNE